MITLRSASYAVGALAFAIILAVWATSPKSAALGAPSPVLYVSDKGTNEITVFSLPALGVKGTISGLNEPRGLCSDPKGHVWVANYGTRQMIEFSGNVPIETINDPDGYPFACSVDSDTTLAYANLTNIVTPSPNPPSTPDPPIPDSTSTPMSGPGEVEVHSISPQLGGMYYFNGVTWDPGDVYIVGTTYPLPGTFVLAVLPSGSSTIQQISVTGGTIHAPGMVQWDADDNYLLVGDRKCGTPRSTCIYRIKISGSTGTITGAPITFEAPNGHVICDMGQGVVGGSGGSKYLVGGDDENECGYTTSSVDRWAFPAGGLPTNSNSTALTKPFGTAISK